MFHILATEPDDIRVLLVICKNVSHAHTSEADRFMNTFSGIHWTM